MELTHTRPGMGVPGRCAAALIALSAMLATTPAMAGDWQAVEDAAREEGALMLYASDPEANLKVYVDAFNKTYPEINVEWARLNSGPMFARFEGEQRAGVVQADVLMSGSSALYQQNPQYFEQLSNDLVPDYEAAKTSVAPENDHYAFWISNVQLATYNTDALSEDDLKEHLTSWEQLADPWWQGKIIMIDPLNTTNVMSWLMVMNDEYGDDWVRKFSANVQTGAGDTAAVQQVAAGAFEIAVPTIDSHSITVREQGAPVAIWKVEGPQHGMFGKVALPLNAPHPNAARVWANWLLGPEAQAIYCSMGSSPVLDGVTGNCVPTPPNFVSSLDVIPEANREHLMSLLKN